MQSFNPAPCHVKINDPSTISVGQALLILIDKYKHNDKKAMRLKKLYLSGARLAIHGDQIKEYMKDPILSNYTISFKDSDISEDPVRRYFETHLAFHTLVLMLEKIAVPLLKNHLTLLVSEVPKHLLSQVKTVLESKDTDFGDDYLLIEYNDTIKNIKRKNDYTRFNKDQKYQIILLMKILYLCIFNAQNQPDKFPMNVYSEGYFDEKSRGRVCKGVQDKEGVQDEKEGQNKVRSRHFGLMKSYMPLSCEDIAYADKNSSYPRAADRCTFLSGVDWCENNFSYFVHPFSCSISGTMLVQLKLLAHLANKGTLLFDNDEKIADYLKATMSLLLFVTGGHSFHEFIAVLAMPVVQENFKFVKDFDNLDEEKLLLDGNEEAFEKAMEATIAYNRQLLKRADLLEEIREKGSRKREYAYQSDSMFFSAQPANEKESPLQQKPSSLRAKRSNPGFQTLN